MLVNFTSVKKLFSPLVTKPKNLLKLVGHLDTCEAVLFSPPPPFSFLLAVDYWCVVLIENTWHSPRHNMKAPSNVRGYFFREERRELSLKSSPASRSAFEALVSSFHLL